jgi:hypothetical protein
MDTRAFARTKIAENVLFDSHQGTGAIWDPKGNKIYFRQTVSRTCSINLDTKESICSLEGYLPCWLNPDGRFVYDSYDQNGQGRGIYTRNSDGSDVTMVASIEELYKVSPYKDAFSVNEVNANLAKWSPNGKYIAVVVWVGSRAGSQIQGSIVIVSKDGSEKWWLSFVGHHHSFTPDNKSLIWGDWTNFAQKRDSRITIIKIDGTDKHFVVDEPYSGHPTMDPSCKKILTSDDQGVILIDINKQDVERLCFFNPKFDLSHAGTHPHCAWNHDGSQIIYNSAQTGKSKLYVMSLQ